MDEYKRKVDSIRAPEALITATLNRIHEEEAKEAAAPQESAVVKTFKPRRRWVGISAIAAVAAALALVVGLNMGSPRMKLTYGTVPDTIVRSNFPATDTQQTELKEYSTRIGMDVESLIPGAAIIKSDAWLVAENGAIVCDACTLTYNAEGKPLTLRLSKTQDIVPEDLTQTEPSDVDGLRVYAAVSESGKSRMAAFRQNGCSFFLTGTNMDQEQFESLLKELIQNIQK